MLGRVGAWNQILGGVPGEVVAYCDSDVLFSLDAETIVEILDTFRMSAWSPRAPFRTPPS